MAIACLRLLGAGVAGRATTLSFFPKLTNPFNVLQVETLHDFEAANSDELNLQRGDVVLVVPSDSEADQVMCKTGRCGRPHWSFEGQLDKWLPAASPFSKMLQTHSEKSLRICSLGTPSVGFQDPFS